MPPTVSRREWRAVLFFAVALVVLTSMPYLLAWTAQGESWRFSGFLFGVEDGHSYLGKMRLGARGLWDFYLFYTPEPHQPASLLFLPYILPGQVVGLFLAPDDPRLTTALAVTYHLLRASANLLLVVVAYRFIAAFLRGPGLRLTTLVLAVLGGGFGWLAALGGVAAPEFYIPEGFTFLIALGLPHLALARAALLGGLLALLVAVHRPRWLHLALVAGGCWLLVGLAVPFYLPVIYVVLAAWGLALWLRRRAFPLTLALRGGVAASVTLPLFAYNVLIFTANPAFAQWSAQNLLASPPPLAYLAAYSLLAVPAAVGARRAWHRAGHSPGFALLVAWVVVVPVLVYLPMNVQRRMAEGVLVPLAILAALGLRSAARWLARGRGRPALRRTWKRLRVGFVLVASLSSLMLLLGSYLAASNPARPLFLPAGQVALFNWLNSTAAPDSIVLAAVPNGNALPAYTNLRPYMGHGPETLDWPAKSRQVQRFFTNQLDTAERAALYRDYAIRYILYGPLERELPRAEITPNWLDDATLIYDQAGYQIYEVNATQNAQP